MKKIVLVVSLFLLFGCSSESQETIQLEQVRFMHNVADIEVTRDLIEGNCLPDGAQVGIHSVSGDPELQGEELFIANALGVVDGYSISTDEEYFFPSIDKQYVFNAYYPYNETLDDNGVGIEIKPQVAEQIDYMYAKSIIASSASPNVNFIFKHALCGVKVFIKRSEDVLDGCYLTEVKLKGDKGTKATMSLSGEIILGDASGESIGIYSPLSETEISSSKFIEAGSYMFFPKTTLKNIHVRARKNNGEEVVFIIDDVDIETPKAGMFTKIEITISPTSTSFTSEVTDWLYDGGKHELNTDSEDVKKPYFNSLLEAAATNVVGSFFVGDMLMRNSVLSPQTYEDYEPVNRAVFHPEKLNIRDRLRLTDSDGVLSLGWVDEADMFYLTTFETLYRTNDIKKRVEDFETLFSATNDFEGSTIRGVQGLSDGELLINTRTPEGYTRLYVTSNSQQTLKQITVDGVTHDYFPFAFRKGVNFQTLWGCSSNENMVLISDYDNGTPRELGGYVWLSMDGGDTFKSIFSLNNLSNVVDFENAITNRAQQHIHGCAIDPYHNNRLWIVTGDGAQYYDNRAVFWSDDYGKTWRWQRTSVNYDGTLVQCVTLYPLPHAVVLGTDAGTCGYMRINRTKSDEAINYEYGKITSTGRLSVFDRQASYKKNMPLLMVQGRNLRVDGENSYLMGTHDGFNFTKLWEDTERLYHSGMAVFQTSDGNVYVRSHEGSLNDINARVILDLGRLSQSAIKE